MCPSHTALSFFVFSIFLLFSLHLSLTVSFHHPLSPSHPLLFLLWFNNWCETFCLSSTGWGGLRLGFGHFVQLTHRHTRFTACYCAGSNRGHFGCINVESKVLDADDVLSISSACSVLIHVSVSCSHSWLLERKLICCLIYCTVNVLCDEKQVCVHG